VATAGAGTAAVAAAKPAGAAAKPAEKAAPPPPPAGVTRREFLNYVWGAAMALMLAETVGVTVLFALPRFREGQFGGKIKVNATDFPQPNATPVPNNLGKFWMVNTDQGIMAHYKVCTHLGCLYGWDDLAQRFACPCHGSQFRYDGEYLAGPAPRGLDQFAFEVYDANDQLIADSPEGQPVPLPPNAASVRVNTGKKINGKSHF
jgi:cytochrome b6-f complex iron-sulfur subunit